MVKKHILVCPICGYSTSPSNGLQFCPKDGSCLRPTKPSSIEKSRSLSPFEIGWGRMRESLRQAKIFPTIKGQAKFTTKFLQPGIIEVTPLSTSKPRPITKHHFKTVYKHWNKTMSYLTTDYTRITKHSVYLLRLFHEFFE